VTFALHHDLQGIRIPVVAPTIMTPDVAGQQVNGLGVGDDYIDYMRGHVVDTYHNIRSKGVEFLRNIYAKAGLPTRPQSKLSELYIVKEFANAQGLDPEKILVEKAFTEPMMTYVEPRQQELADVEQLSRAVMQRFRQDSTRLPSNPSKIQRYRGGPARVHHVAIAFVLPTQTPLFF